MWSIASLRGEAAGTPSHAGAPKPAARRHPVFGTVAAMSLLVACTSDSGLILDPLTDDQLANATMEILEGADQEGTVGDDAPRELLVIVRAPDGSPLAGAPVWWSFSDGEGWAPGATQGRDLFETSTDAHGISRVRWNLGTVAGDQEAAADLDPPSVTTLDDTGSASFRRRRRWRRFRTRAKPAAPAQIIVSADSVRMEVGQQFNLTGTVRDQYGNEIPDAVIEWRSVDPSIATVTTPTPSSFNRIG